MGTWEQLIRFSHFTFLFRLGCLLYDGALAQGLWFSRLQCGFGGCRFGSSGSISFLSIAIGGMFDWLMMWLLGGVGLLEWLQCGDECFEFLHLSVQVLNQEVILLVPFLLHLDALLDGFEQLLEGLLDFWGYLLHI